MAALRQRHRNWKNPTIQAILDFVEANEGVDRCWPTWTTPELPTWQLLGKLVLVGDAAHALQPSSGQGACQALEDAETLALLLKHYLTPIVAEQNEYGHDNGNLQSQGQSQEQNLSERRIGQALDRYVAIRSPRIHKIYVRTQKISRMKMDLGLFMEMTMYLMIYMMTWFKDEYGKELMDYDVPQEVEKVINEMNDS